MELTEELIEHIEDLEGKKLTAYRDVNGIPTIGYGHTNAAGSFKFKMGDKITEEQALEILQEDLNEAEIFVEQMLENRNLNVTNQQKKDYMTLVYFNRPWALRDTMEVIAGNNFDAIRPSQLEVYKDNRTEEIPEWYEERINKEIAYLNEFDDPDETGGNIIEGSDGNITLYLDGEPLLVERSIADTIVKNTKYTYDAPDDIETSPDSNLRREQKKYLARIKLGRVGE